MFISLYLLYSVPLPTSLWSTRATNVEFQSVTHSSRIMTILMLFTLTEQQELSISAAVSGGVI